MKRKPSLLEMKNELQKFLKQKEELQDSMRREYHELILLETSIDELQYQIHAEEDYF